MLLEERSPGGCAPVIILRDWDHLVHWNVHRFYSVEFQCVKPQKLGLWIELHSQNKTLWSKGGFNHEWKHGVYFGLIVSGTQAWWKVSSAFPWDLIQLCKFRSVVDEDRSFRTHRWGSRSGNLVIGLSADHVGKEWASLAVEHGKLIHVNFN